MLPLFINCASQSSSVFPILRVRPSVCHNPFSSNFSSTRWSRHNTHPTQNPNPQPIVSSCTHHSDPTAIVSPQASVTSSPTQPTPSTPPPPPGREDEFADSNGESLQQSTTSSKVATLERDPSFDTVLQELSAIQQDGPRNVAILGTRHTSYLHQQIIELLTYANVLVGNHVFTSGAGGTNAAVIRGALRAESPDLLTVVLPQSLHKQPAETQNQLRKVRNLIEMKQNDPLPLDVASQLCNSDILSRCTHFIAFAFHDSDVVLEAVRQAKELRIVVTVLYLD